MNENKLLEVRKVHSKLNFIKRKGNAENPYSGALFSLETTRKNNSGIYEVEFVRTLKQVYSKHIVL